MLQNGNDGGGGERGEKGLDSITMTGNFFYDSLFPLLDKSSAPKLSTNTTNGFLQNIPFLMNSHVHSRMALFLFLCGFL